MNLSQIPFYKNYRDYKPHLRNEFNFRCVYCETREPEIGGSRNFGIDHYKPKSKYPKLETAYKNLLYACNECNNYKGQYWPTQIQKFLKQIILNPRIDNINEHINNTSPAWKSKTPRGEWNLLKLRLSSEARIKRRQERIMSEKMIKDLESQKARLDPYDPQTASIIKEISEKIENLKYRIAGSMD